MLNTKTIGNRIAEARKKKNISQAELAGFLFISPQAVGKWERGESAPDIITMNRLAEILGVDLNYFSESFASADAPPKANMEHAGNTNHTIEDAPSHSPGRQLLTDFSGS